MTNRSQGSPGAPQIPYSSPSIGIMPRRSSYASVAAGATIASQHQSSSGRSGTFSHLMNPTPSPPIYFPQTHADHSRLSHGTADWETRGEDIVHTQGNWAKAGGLPDYPDHYFHAQGHGLTGGEVATMKGFLKPTYLRGSKYLERLEIAYRLKLAAQRELYPIYSSGVGSLSTSSSSVSLHKLAPSHRGMTYEIIEHQPPVDDEGLTPLPSKWAEADKYGGLDIAGDGLDVKYVGLSKLGDHEAAAARADHPMPPQCGIYYYEVTIVSNGKDGMIGVGFSGSKASLEKLPGWEPESWAYHGDDGKSFCCQSTGKAYGPKFTTADVIGCGVNFMTGCAFFTKNGVFKGNAFRDLKNVSLYPSVGMKRPQAHLSVNFGQKPFVFDIDGMMVREKSNISGEISSVNVSKLYPRLDENALLKELVAQFLAHDGYVESAKAFAEEVHTEDDALKNISSTLADGIAIIEDIDAVNRQRTSASPVKAMIYTDCSSEIRAAILEGDIDKALKRTNAFYPYVLRDNPRIYFQLRCRKFVEMIRKGAEILDDPTEKKLKSMNGNSAAVSDDDFEPEMELDDQSNSVDDWDKMETEEADNDSMYQDHINDTLRYGRELRYEFKDDRSKYVEDAFKDIFAMFAYPDPRKSPTSHLLDRGGRVPVAEELNSAILVSLGKSSSAAVERLYQQTEVLVSEISEEGGAGAFINVQNDFLR